MRSMNFRLMVFFCSLLIPTLVTMGIYSYRLASSVVEEKTSAAVLNSLEQRAKNLEVKMQAYKKYLDLVIYTPEFMNVVKSNSFDKTSYSTTRAHRELKDILDAIFFEDDMVKAFTVYKNEELVYKYGNDILDEEKFKQNSLYTLTKAANGAIYFGGTLKLGLQPGEEDLYIGYGRELIDYNSVDNTDLGSVFLFMDIRSFSTLIDDVREMSFITDNEGHVLASPDSSQIFNNIKDKPGFRKAYESHVSGYYVDESESRNFVIAYYTLPNWNLKIVQVMPRKEIIGETSNILFATMGVSLLIFVLLVITALLLSRRVSKPAKQIKEAMKKIQAGDFDTRLDVKSRDEFGSIAVSLNFMTVQLKELLDKLIQEERRRSETEFSMLQYQINPHFLHNVLATIRLSAVSNHDPDTAEMLQKLSRLLRRTLANAGRMVTLETELCNIRDFVDIQKVLSNENIRMVYEIGEPSANCLIPNMLLQPLVENTIIHGFGEGVSDPEIRISSRLDHDRLQLIVEDNGIGMTEETMKKLQEYNHQNGMSYNRVGIMNVNRRIKLYFGDDSGLFFERAEGRGTKAIIVLKTSTDGGGTRYEKNSAGR